MPVTKLELGARHGNVMIRHNELAMGMGALIFIHGLGGSRQVFLEAFESGRFEAYNVFAPDLPGFGNSPGGVESTLTGLLHCLETIIEHFKIHRCVLVGHGMGGDLACWLAQRTVGSECVCGVINVEGTRCEEALVYGDAAIAAAEDPARTYTKWFVHGFMENTILRPHIGKDPAYRRFYESLQMCRPGTFLTLARDMRDKLYTDATRSVIYPAQAFDSLKMPKSYCLAEHGFNGTALPELELHGLPHLVFRDASHWLMVDQPLAFYAHVEAFARKHLPPLSLSERLKFHFLDRFKSWLDRFPQAPRRWLDKIRFFIRTRIKRKL